jgi:histidinol-phosphate aminotransferase
LLKVRLDLNENRFVPWTDVAALLGGVAAEQCGMYPEYEGLYEALARYAGLPASQLLVTNGADQAIETVLRTFCPRRRLVLPVPTFSYYTHVASLLGIDQDKIPYTRHFQLDVEATLRALSPDVDGVALVSPSNPLGSMIPREATVALLERARRHGCFVLIDEVYYEFASETSLDLLDRFSNLILIRSLSKGHGLAGVRVGYVAAREEVIQELHKVRGPWDVNVLAAEVGAAALRSPTWLAYRALMRVGKARLEKRLRSEGFHVTPTMTNFAIASHPRAGELATDLARQHGILVSNLSGYPDSGGMLEGFLRIGVPHPSEEQYVLDSLSGLMRRSKPLVEPRTEA